MRNVDGIAVFGEHDQATFDQIRRCAADAPVRGAALMADGHKGYSMPVGGVVAYAGAISPSGVGYDIGCGNEAVRTSLRAADVLPDINPLLDRIFSEVSFGVGRKNAHPIAAPVLEGPTWTDIPALRPLRQLAASQLGTVGSGNHYVDLLADEAGYLWVACHFGSRGFGYKTASGFLNLAAGRQFNDKAPGESMDQPATLLSLATPTGQDYFQAMQLAGEYAYAGRDAVVAQVLGILGNPAVTDEVHNHHNFAWLERHDGEDVYVVRKGATPAWPGQRGFVGGSMGDVAYVVEGVASPLADAALHSTVHGAGRVMSRTEAAGKRKWGTNIVLRPGKVSPQMMAEWLEREGVTLRGGGLDESPHAYRRLPDVLAAQEGTVRVLHTLRPIGVCMAGADIVDPYKD
jgi:tRNA-splicing ligase RtcB (3'-phosphate/5'-hydroxy nucleic acid ligase)